MKSVAFASAVALPALVGATKCKPWVTSEALQDDVKLSSIVSGSYRLQNIADANGGNRVFGSGGERFFADGIDFGIGICVEAVDCYDDVDAVLLGVLDLFFEIHAACSKHLCVFRAIYFR